MAKRIRMKKGTMQDASFIEEDEEEYEKPRDKDADATQILRNCMDLIMTGQDMLTGKQKLSG